MITNKDIRVENGSLILNGDHYPLDGQSPEAIMQIVEDNSDTTPTENSDAPITSGGVYTAIDKVDTKIGANAGSLTQRAQLTTAGSTTYIVVSDSALAVVQFEGYVTAAADAYEGSVSVNNMIIGYLGCREGVVCSPAKREQIRIPFKVYKDDVISISLSLTGTATGYVTLFTN